MKKDLDAIMEANHLDAVLVTGPAQHNPAMVYFTGLAHLSQADLIKKRGEQAVVFHGMMERDEAAKSGLKTISYSKYPYAELLKEADGDRQMVVALRYAHMLRDAGVVRGRVAIYGLGDVGASFSVFSRLQKLMPDLELTGFTQDEILMQAMMTKDESEIDHIRQMGKVTTGVVGRVADYLTGQKLKGEILVDSSGQPVTIGKVKSLINLWLAEGGADNPEGTIFAMGRDAGVPHSTGNPDDALRLGQTIVFDIYPCQTGGGYFYDFTRTWCLGYAPDAAQKLYDDVRSVYDTIMSELRVNTPFGIYQRRTCELYEAMGHPTILNTPDTESGYIHSLGHGVGLRVHEKPWSGMQANDSDSLVPGSVFTVEPGLYYPEKGMGVRLEDTLWVKPDGQFEIFAPYPLDLVLPIK